MIGPPGSGKSMLAKRIPGILPKMSLEESFETTRIHSVAGLVKPDESLVKRRPFRSPHHTISDIGLIGGSANPNPGEVSLSHNGVLFPSHDTSCCLNNGLDLPPDWYSPFLF